MHKKSHSLKSLKTPEIQKPGQQPRQRPTDFIGAESDEVYLDEAGSKPQVGGMRSACHGSQRFRYVPPRSWEEIEVSLKHQTS